MSTTDHNIYIPTTARQVGEDRIMVFDSATYVDAHYARDPAPGRDVVVNCSYAGVYCAKHVAPHAPLGAIGVDCGIGKDGAGVAGLWFYEALGIPAAAANVVDVELGNGPDLYACGVITRVNQAAEAIGVVVGSTVADAAAKMLHPEPVVDESPGPVPRWIVEAGDGDGDVVCIDSIADALPEDADRNVLCTAGHTGRSVVVYIEGFRPRGFICSDGGGAKNDSGVSALRVVEDTIPGAAVDAQTARMGDGRSTYFDGVISAHNDAARRLGVRVGMPATEAAHLMLVGTTSPTSAGEESQ